jgi:hypothetical protein
MVGRRLIAVIQQRKANDIIRPISAVQILNSMVSYTARKQFPENLSGNQTNGNLDALLK